MRTARYPCPANEQGLSCVSIIDAVAVEMPEHGLTIMVLLSTNMMIYVGVDSGVSGALCAVGSNKEIVGMFPMPLLKGRKGNEIDPSRVWNWLDSVGPVADLTVVIEEPGGSQSARAGASMAGSFHTLRTVFILKQLRFHRVTPQAWQKVILPGCPAGDTKPRALTTARALWPTERWLRTALSRVPDDNIIDAALIAEYGRRSNL